MDDHGRDPAHWPSAQDRAEIDAAFFNDAPERPRGGYRRASDEVWDLAQRDYQAGDTAADVCARYGLKVSTLRDRAASGGWRRLDTPHAAPDPVDLDSDEAADLPDYRDMARAALIRMNRALKAGRAVEAGSWMRLHEKLMAQAARPDPEPSPPPPPSWVDHTNLEARQAAINARFAEMPNYYAHIRRPSAEAAPEPAPPGAPGVGVSDNSDNSHPVFSAPQSETATPVMAGHAAETAPSAMGISDHSDNSHPVFSAPQSEISPAPAETGGGEGAGPEIRKEGSGLPEAQHVLHVVQAGAAGLDPDGGGHGAPGEQGPVDGRMAQGQDLVVRGEQDGMVAHDPPGAQGRKANAADGAFAGYALARRNAELREVCMPTHRRGLAQHQGGP